MDNSYVEMCMRVLSNGDWYHPVSPKYYQGIESDYRSLIGTVQSLRRHGSFWMSKTLENPCFTPKLHKHKKSSWASNGVRCRKSEAASQFDRFLRPHVSLASHVKDTIPLEQLEGMCVPSALLVALDVESLLQPSKFQRAGRSCSFFVKSWQRPTTVLPIYFGFAKICLAS